MTDGQRQPDKSDAFGTPQPDQLEAMQKLLAQQERDIEDLTRERDDWKSKAQYFYKEREEAWAEVARIQPLVDARFAAKEVDMERMRSAQAERQRQLELREDDLKAQLLAEGAARATPLSWSKLWEDFLCLISVRS